MAAVGAPVRVPVAVACRILGFSTQGYYKWLKQPISVREAEERELIAVLRKLHADDPEGGYRVLADDIGELGYTVSERRVWRLCRVAGIQSVIVTRTSRYKKAGAPVHDDLVQRQFTAEGPNQLWLTDITEHRTREGKVYLCAIKDVFSNRIVGYSIDSRMKARIAVNALRDGRGSPGAAGRGDRALGPRVPIQVEEILQGPQTSRAPRLDGPGRSLWRQRSDGVILRPAAEKRPRPPTLDYPPRTPPRDRLVDRGQVPPETPSTPTRETHPHRVRTHHEPSRYTGGINPEVNQTFSSPVGQSASCPAARVSIDDCPGAGLVEDVVVAGGDDVGGYECAGCAGVEDLPFF